jgi:hypothetical protein
LRLRGGERAGLAFKPLKTAKSRRTVHPPLFLVEELLRLKRQQAELRSRLGHSTIGITLDLYSHVLPGMQEDAARRFDGALRAALQARETGS